MPSLTFTFPAPKLIERLRIVPTLNRSLTPSAIQLRFVPEIGQPFVDYVEFNHSIGVKNGTFSAEQNSAKNDTANSDSMIIVSEFASLNNNSGVIEIPLKPFEVDVFSQKICNLHSILM